MRRVTRRGKTIVSKASCPTSTISAIPRITATMLMCSFQVGEVFGACRLCSTQQSRYGCSAHAGEALPKVPAVGIRGWSHRFEKLLVNVAPSPFLIRLERANDGV